MRGFRCGLADLDGLGDGLSEIGGREGFFEGGSEKGEAIFVRFFQEREVAGKEDQGQAWSEETGLFGQFETVDLRHGKVRDERVDIRV